MASFDLDDDIGPSLVEMTLEAPPPGHAVQITTDDLNRLSAVHFAPITALRCEVKREQGDVLRRIREAAAMSSDEFYYSFPVRTKGGGRDYIEGISVDGAQAVMQAFGNCECDVRPVDIGHSWIFLARFIDHERGTSLIRPFLQRKQGGSRLGGDDEGRRLEIAFSIGASKAARNVISNAIRPFTNYCFKQSKEDLVKRVGADLPKNRDRALARVAELGVDLKLVESQLGRVASEWTAREVAAVIVQVRTVQQGLATVADIWPVPPPPEPRRSDSAVEPGPADRPDTAAEPAGAGGVKPTPEPVTDTSPSPSPAAATDQPELIQWAVADSVLGQPAIILALVDLIELAQSGADLDAIEQRNADRIAKITGTKGATLRQAIRDRRLQVGGSAS